MAKLITETIYHVSDVKEAVAFYSEKLGFTVQTVEDWGWAELTLGPDGPRIGLLLESTVRKPGDVYPAPRIGIRTDEFHKEVEGLKERGVRVGRLSGEGETMKACNFYDEDGNAFFLWDNGQAIE